MRGTISLCLTVFVMAAMATGAAAQDRATGGGQVALGNLRFEERFTQGHLDGCELVYLVAFEDNIYRQGAGSALRGSVQITALLAAPNKPPLITFKVTAFDVVGDEPSFAPLHYAYLSANGISYAGKEAGKFTCEDGGVCMGFSVFDNTDLMEALIGGSFEINVTRTPNGSDVKVPLNIRRDEPQTWRTFAQCTVKLLEVMKAKLGD